MWMWAALAAILLAGEVITTSFVLLFFAASAFLTAIAVGLAPEPGLSSSVQILLFGVLGLVGLAVGRRWIKTRLALRAPAPFEVDSSSEFTIDRDLEVGAEGAVLYQGAPWTAVNSGSSPLRAGERVRVTKTSGIKLIIERASK